MSFPTENVAMEKFVTLKKVHAHIAHCVQVVQAERKHWLNLLMQDRNHKIPAETVYKDSFPNVHNLQYANMPFEFPRTLKILSFCSGGRSFLYLDRLDATILLTTMSTVFEVNFYNGF